MTPKRLLRAMFDAAVASAASAHRVPPFLPTRPKGRTVVVGAGKAAAAMAQAVEQHWEAPLSGLVITRYGHAVPCRAIEVVEAAHPVPDAAGLAATRRMVALVNGLTADDLVLCLLSGGASALMAAPPPGVPLDDERGIVAALLRSGATIAELNNVRKHLSTVKGGRLALAAAPARVVTLLISDVPGDDPSVIGSGPTVPDPTTRQDAIAVLARHAIDVPQSVARWLDSPASETPDALDGVDCRVIATPQGALDAAAAVALAAGYVPVILGDAIEGEARAVALDHAAAAIRVRDLGLPLAAPAVLLSGGETTVTVRGSGRGGRNAEFLLALAIALEGAPGIHALAADTDGIDGTEDNAGAAIGPAILTEAARHGVSATAHLADNDGYGFFDALGALVKTGPTRTNVNDFRAILIDRTSSLAGAPRA